MKLFRRIFTLFLTAAMCLSLVPGAAAAGNPFTDVPDGEWYAADVQRAYELGLINGTSKTTFSPGEKLHYCEAIKLAACMNQRYEQGRVTLTNSASGKWYDSYVAYAVEHNIIWDASDYDWDAVATRAGYMEIFASALPYEALEEINSIPYGAIPDVPEDSENEWAIYHLYRAGIVQGTDAATHACSPNNTILRQEVATILTRMMDKSKRIHFNMSMSDTAALGELNEWIDMDEEGFKDDDGYIALAEWPELLEYMADSAQTLKDDGTIASFSYSEENAYILYTLKTGLWVIYEPRIREYKDYAGGGNVSVFEPYHANTIKFPRLPHQANYPTNARNTIVDLNEGYTPGATLFDSAVTLSQVAAEFNRAKDGVIIWMGHGGWTEETGSGLFIGETYDEAKHKTLRDKKEIAVSTENGRIALLSGFFEKELNANSLDGTLLVLGTCSSLADGRLANALKGKGAACVIGSRTPIRVVGLYDQVKKLIDAFASKDENGKYNSASQAVIEATYNAGGSVVGELSYAFGADYRLVVGKNATVSGTVIDGNTKKPIEKASVSCGSRSTLTDANGAFSFTDMAELSSYTVKVGAGFYEDVSLTVRLTEAQNMTIKMYPAGIIDLYTSPSNASVRLYETNGSRDADAIIAGGSPIRQSPAGSAFHWKMTGLYNGREYLISASANGYYTKNVFVKAALSPGETRITLERIAGVTTTSVSVTVTDSNTGKPVSGAAVKCLLTGENIGTGQTDASGKCAISLSRAVHSFTLSVSKSGYQTGETSVTVTSASGVNVAMKLTPAPDETPAPAQQGVVAIDCGSYFMAALKADGSLWTWGNNDAGQLGTGNTSSSNKPVRVMDGVASFDCGTTYMAAVKTDGSLWVWGNNEDGQLGIGTQEDSNVPVKIMDGVRSVSCGQWHAAAVKTDGSLWAWGYYGESFNDRFLGDGSGNGSAVPVRIIGSGVKAVSCGFTNTMALKADGSLWAWGSSFLGNGSWYSPTYSPIYIMDGVKVVSNGLNFTAAIKTDGSLWTWGTNKRGQLGNGVSGSDNNDPYVVSPARVMDGVIGVCCGAQNMAVITKDGTLLTCGSDGSRALGRKANNAAQRSTPGEVMGDVKAAAYGRYFGAAIKNDGTVWAWGSNTNGQLGNGTRDDASAPTQVTFP